MNSPKDKQDLIDRVRSTPKHSVPELIRRTDPAEVFKFFHTKDEASLELFLSSLDAPALAWVLSVVDSPLFLKSLAIASDRTVSHIISIISSKHLSKLAASGNDYIVDRLIKLAPSRDIRMKIAKSLPYSRQKKWLDVIGANEESLAAIKKITDGASASFIEERLRVVNDLDFAVAERKQLLETLQSEESAKRNHFESLISQAQSRLSQVQQTIVENESTLREREAELAKRMAEFEEASKKQVQQRIEAKVPEFVKAAVDVLDKREVLYRNKAFWWSVHGTVVLTFAISAAVWISLYGYVFGEKLSTLDWQAFVFISFKGLVVIGILGLWAKHAFTVSNAYMHEAIKRSDRAHAINFGKLYLEVYGNTVERKELLNIFENWNITSESAFSKSVPEGFEPKILEKIADILKMTDRNSAGAK